MRDRLAVLTIVWHKREYRAFLLIMVFLSLATSSTLPLVTLYLVLGTREIPDQRRSMMVAWIVQARVPARLVSRGAWLNRRSDPTRSMLVAVDMEDRAMPTEVHRNEVRRLLDTGAQLVEVLPPQEYEAEHLPGAVNIPLKQMNAATTARLRRDAPVIVYCYDYQ